MQGVSNLSKNCLVENSLNSFIYIEFKCMLMNKFQITFDENNFHFALMKNGFTRDRQDIMSNYQADSQYL